MLEFPEHHRLNSVETKYIVEEDAITFLLYLFVVCGAHRLIRVTVSEMAELGGLPEEMRRVQNALREQSNSVTFSRQNFSDHILLQFSTGYELTISNPLN